MMSGLKIHEMPFKERQELVDILNCGDSWKELGGYYMGYNTVQLDKFGREIHKVGRSPADALLTHWGTRNHTVVQLFKLLRKMKHFQAMESIKSLVPSKYHEDIKPQQSNSLKNTHIKCISSTQSAPHPPPPIKYSQANVMMADNLDFKEEKDYTKKLGCLASNTTKSLNISGEKWPSNERIKSDPVEIVGMGSSPNGGAAAAASSAGTSWQSTKPSILKSRNPSGIPTPDPDLFFQNVPFEELKACCNGFSKDNLLGKGGFGEVYKGKRNNNEIAVKLIRSDKAKKLMNDPEYIRIVYQFIAELKAMHTFPGEFILRLICYSFQEDFSTEPCLVYQYMPNGSLSDRLKCKNNTPPLNWDIRANIALGTAKGLCHLHGSNIIHGDIKSGNILLSRNFEPVIGDFGLARGGADNFEKSYRTVSVIIGTDFYLPDDYKRNHQLHPAIDTYSFGIVLFELVSGLSPATRVPCPPGPERYQRDIMLDAKDPSLLVDERVPFDNWTIFLFKLGKDCAKAKRPERPSMGKVCNALEKLMPISKDVPHSLALQQYYDEWNKAGDVKVEMVVTNNEDDGIPDIPSIVKEALVSGEDCEVESSSALDETTEESSEVIMD